MRGVGFVSTYLDGTAEAIRVWCSQACALADTMPVPSKENLRRATFDMSRDAKPTLQAIAILRLKCDGCGRSLWDLSLMRGEQ